jgi:hypothetical protein
LAEIVARETFFLTLVQAKGYEATLQIRSVVSFPKRGELILKIHPEGLRRGSNPKG